MDAATRKRKLEELKATESNVVMTGIPLRYKGDSLTVKVYKIPLDFLVYNKYNGRIGTEVLSYEQQNGELNAENERDKKIIEKFLYDSKVDRNEKTLKSLQQDKQQRYGIVTADGTIIDGNRRAMLLNKLFHERERYSYTYAQVEHCKYFLAIILPDDAEEKDIQQLETIYQMGQDDKLDYNPIEKYLKCKQLKKLGFTEDNIAEFMGEKTAKIKEWLSVLQLMEEFLCEYGYDGIYTRLDKTEGPFVDLNGYLLSYDKGGANVRTVDWQYNESDLSDLKRVCFDYIRARYEGKEFREIAKTGRDGSIFFHKDLWDEFLENHQNDIPGDRQTVEECRQENPNEDLSMLLKRRDNDWIESAKGKLKGNLQRYSRKLDDKRDSNKPAELIERALGALKAVDFEQESFLTDENIKVMIKEINTISWQMKKILERS